MFRNEIGTNLYHFMVTRCLRSATRCLQAVHDLTGAPYGTIPIEVLLRSALVASAKALFLVMPEKQEKRELRMQQIYSSDRSALEYAINAELKLVGEPTGAPGGKKTPGVADSKVVRDVVDDLVERGNCQCGAEGCPQEDLDGIRHRILRLWWLYSAVTHVSIWHIEKATETAPSGETTSTGNIGDAVFDIGWLYAQAVTFYARRYDMFEDNDFLEWEQ